MHGFLAGTLDRQIMRRIGFPWSEGLVRRTLASVGGTLAATEQALRTGMGGTLAGGTHHAFRAEGAGFCVFNDIAVAIHSLRGSGKTRRTAVLDLDVHQGDGTALLFQDDAHAERRNSTRRLSQKLITPPCSTNRRRGRAVRGCPRRWRCPPGGRCALAHRRDERLEGGGHADVVGLERRRAARRGRPRTAMSTPMLMPALAITTSGRPCAAMQSRPAAGHRGDVAHVGHVDRRALGGPALRRRPSARISSPRRATSARR